MQTDLANQFLLGRRCQVSHFLKIDGAALTVARGQSLFAGFTGLIDLKRLGGAAGKSMNARRRCRFAGTVLGDDQHGNIILRQLADHGFDRTHARTDAFEPDAAAPFVRLVVGCQDFGSVETHAGLLFCFAVPRPKTAGGDVLGKMRWT